MKHPYDFESEATALVARMSIDEKASLMSGSSFGIYNRSRNMICRRLWFRMARMAQKQGNQADHRRA